jgi:hypothetical protein
MKKSFLQIVLTLLSIRSFAQDSTEFNIGRPRNSVHLNFLGNASILSLNFERLYLINTTTFLSFNLGVGYNKNNVLGNTLYFMGTTPPPLERVLTIPHSITLNIGKRKHFFEGGLGGSTFLGNSNSNYFLFPIIGYRRQPLESALFNFRVFLNIPLNGGDELNGWDESSFLFSPLGLSVGLCF